MDFTVVRNQKRTYLERVEQRGMFPSPKYRQCTSGTLSDVLAWHWVNAIRLHPVYVPEHHDDGAKDGYLRRLSCRVRIFATDADLAAISLHDRPASSGSLNSNGN